MSRFGAKMAHNAVTEIILDRKIVEKQIVMWYGWENRNSLSRGAPSTTRPPLRCGVPMAMWLLMQGIFRVSTKKLRVTPLQFLAPDFGTFPIRVGTYDTNLAQPNLGTFWYPFHATVG